MTEDIICFKDKDNLEFTIMDSGSSTEHEKYAYDLINDIQDYYGYDKIEMMKYQHAEIKFNFDVYSLIIPSNIETYLCKDIGDQQLHPIYAKFKFKRLIDMWPLNMIQ